MIHYEEVGNQGKFLIRPFAYKFLEVGANPIRASLNSSTNSLDKTSSSVVGSQGKVVDLAEIYNFPLGTFWSKTLGELQGRALVGVCCSIHWTIELEVAETFSVGLALADPKL